MTPSDATAPGGPDPDCVFCRIVAGEIPSERVHEDEQVIAFHDLSPQAPVHLLVVPRTHLRDVRELSADPELLAHVTTVAGRLAGTRGGDFRLSKLKGRKAPPTASLRTRTARPSCVTSTK